jgi:hypothetical protein
MKRKQKGKDEVYPTLMIQNEILIRVFGTLNVPYEYYNESIGNGKTVLKALEETMALYVDKINLIRSGAG